jgi:hypothetical protein
MGAHEFHLHLGHFNTLFGSTVRNQATATSDVESGWNSICSLLLCAAQRNKFDLLTAQLDLKLIAGN